MGWLIAGLAGLMLLGGLLVLARRRSGHHRGADDTLVTELLGPREAATAPAPQAAEEPEHSPAPQAAEEPEPSPALQAPEEPQHSPAPQAAKAAESSAPPSGLAADGDWLEAQMAWITAWSQQMHEQIESAGGPGPDHTE